MGSPIIFSGIYAKTLKDKINLFDSAYIVTGTADPTSTATDGPRGSIYMRTGGSGGAIYRKTDNGSSTNWTRLGDFGGAGNQYTWNTVAVNTAMANGNAYITNAAAVITLTLPATASVGDSIMVVGRNTGGWIIGQNAGQSIIKEDTQTTVGVTGQLKSTHENDCVEIVCIVADTTWIVVDYTGQPSGQLSTGFVVGGANASELTSIERMSFSLETFATSSATLSAARRYGAGTSSPVAGFYQGGYDGTGTTTTISKLVFDTENNITLAATMDTGIAFQASIQSSAIGYACGGISGVVQDKIEDMIWAAESSATIATVLASARELCVGTSSSTKGYPAGGNVNKNDIQAFVFSGETISTLAAVLEDSKYAFAPAWSTTDGYYIGGINNGGTRLTSIRKLSFGAETASTLAATLDTAVTETGGTHSDSKGYSLGGNQSGGSPYVNVVEDLVFATDTSAAIAGTLVAQRRQPTGFFY